jgi:hypothetical protein
VIGFRSHLLNRRVLIAHGLVGAVALTLASTAALRAVGAPPQAPLSANTIRLDIEAAPGAAYQMLCHVRTYKTAMGQLVNSYGVTTKGPYHDVIQSPLAECQIKKTGGPGPVKVIFSKPGSVKSAVITVTGPAGQTALSIF